MALAESEACVLAVLAVPPGGRATMSDEIAAALDATHDAVARVTPGLIDERFVKRFSAGKPFRHQIAPAARKVIGQPAYREVRQKVSSKAKQ